jgi:predicted transport protein
VANSFTVHQQQAINFKDLPIEIWEAKYYDNGTILYNELKAQDTSASIKTVTKNNTIQKVSNEVKVYSLSDHFGPSKEQTLELYTSLREKLLAIEPHLQENIRGNYIGLSLRENGLDTLVYIQPQIKKLRLFIPRMYPKDVSDPLKKLAYKKNSLETKNTPESILNVTSDEEVDYAVTILRQARAKFFK